MVNIKKLSENAKIPSKARNTDAGYDLTSVESYELKPGERKAFKTDIAMAIPHNLYGRIAPRSGLALKKGIDVLGGVIDNSYRGEILVALINLGQEPIKIESGDKIAQIIFENYTNLNFELVDNLDDTSRGSSGFGSSDSPISLHSNTDVKNEVTMDYGIGGVIKITKDMHPIMTGHVVYENIVPTTSTNPTLIDQYQKHGGQIGTVPTYEEQIRKKLKQ